MDILYNFLSYLIFSFLYLYVTLIMQLCLIFLKWAISWTSWRESVSNNTVIRNWLVLEQEINETFVWIWNWSLWILNSAPPSWALFMNNFDCDTLSYYCINVSCKVEHSQWHGSGLQQDFFQLFNEEYPNSYKRWVLHTADILCGEVCAQPAVEDKMLLETSGSKEGDIWLPLH